MSDMLHKLVVNIRNYASLKNLPPMSDMLQLVVKIGKTQATILPVTSHVESPQP